MIPWEIFTQTHALFSPEGRITGEFYFPGFVLTFKIFQNNEHVQLLQSETNKPERKPSQGCHRWF